MLIFEIFASTPRKLRERRSTIILAMVTGTYLYDESSNSNNFTNPLKLETKIKYLV